MLDTLPEQHTHTSFNFQFLIENMRGALWLIIKLVNLSNLYLSVSLRPWMASEQGLGSPPAQKD